LHLLAKPRAGLDGNGWTACPGARSNDRSISLVPEKAESFNRALADCRAFGLQSIACAAAMGVEAWQRIR
jgi:hypothetical protein